MQNYPACKELTFFFFIVYLQMKSDKSLSELENSDRMDT